MQLLKHTNVVFLEKSPEKRQVSEQVYELLISLPSDLCAKQDEFSKNTRFEKEKEKPLLNRKTVFLGTDKLKCFYCKSTVTFCDATTKNYRFCGSLLRKTVSSSSLISNS